MASPATEIAPARAGNRPLPALAAIALVPLAAVVVLGLAVADRPVAAGRAGLAGLRFGWPLGWLGQDQSSTAPPLPHHTSFLSPWEYPTQVRALPLLADLLLVTTALAVVGGVAVLVVRSVRNREARRSRPA